MERGDATTGNRPPVSLLTGFLGSGKPTVLNYLVRQPAPANTVVIINEFGEIGLNLARRE
jgi:G3E family GTPase